MTPATLRQGQKLLELATQAHVTGEEIQRLLANGDLFKLLLYCPDLSKVDRTAFKALLTTVAAPVAWTPVGEYADRIAARNDLCRWGLSSSQIRTFGASLTDHLDPLQPTGLRMWLGRDLEHNWEQAVAWLGDELGARGKRFRTFVDPSRVSFYPGSTLGGPPSLVPVRLDLEYGWNRHDGLIPGNLRLNRGLVLAGLEIAWTLALSPQIHLAIDGRTFPGMLAAGLVVDSTGVPNFERIGNMLPFVGCVEAGARTARQTVVILTKC